MEYGLSARTSGCSWFSLGWFGMHGPAAAGLLCGLDPISCCKGRCCGCSWGTRAPCPSCCRSAGGAHAPRTRPCSACCPGCRTGAGLHAKGQAFARRRGAGAALGCDSVAGAGPRGRHAARRLVGGGRAWVCALARGLGAGFGAASAVLGAGRAAGAAWAGAAALPTAGDATAGPAVTGATGAAALPRRRGRNGCQWHRCGAGVSRCRGADLGRRWLHAGRWGRGLGAQQTTRPARRPRRYPQAERCIFGSRARAGRCRLWRQRPGRWSRGFGWRTEGAGASGAAGSLERLGRQGACALQGADTGVAAERGDVSPSAKLGAAACGWLWHDWLWLWLWLWAGRSWQEQSRSRSSLLPRPATSTAVVATAPATHPEWCPARAQRLPRGIQQQIPPRLKGCRAKAPAGPGGCRPRDRRGRPYQNRNPALPVLGQELRPLERLPLPWRTMPHCPQNLAPSLHGAAHSGQCCTSGAPQSLQHLAPSRFSVAQAGQFKLMGLPC